MNFGTMKIKHHAIPLSNNVRINNENRPKLFSLYFKGFKG